ncbi:MAG: 4-phosphopantetheinyl transferase [Deltaproteobacteria bacterium]|nr:4-phosphopantetheinyl transferase [Deltaproteobacteria bacterium]
MREVIDVYTAAPAREDVTAALGLLSVAERAQAARFAIDGVRRSWIVAHALVRRALSRHAPVDPEDWQFAPRADGRPEITAPRAGLRFNLSHGRALVACAVSGGPDVGIDVEDAQRQAPLELVDRVFSPIEREAFATLPAAERADRFCFHWTMKEAYLKARGLGLVDELDRLTFHPESPVRASFAADWDDDPASWQLESRVIEGHRVAVAIRHRGVPALTLRVHPPAR